MNEIIFMVEEAPESGFTARALGESIFTESDTWEELKEAAQEAVHAHFENEIYRIQIINNVRQDH